MPGELTGKIALVTGGSSGIGKETASALAEEGATLALAARGKDRLETTAAELRDEHGVEVLARPTDISQEARVESLVEQTVDRFGALDIVVNNAGVVRGLGKSTAKLSTDNYRTMMETNVDGAFFVTRAALPHLKERKGNLVFVGSFAGRFPRSFHPVYAATKWWLRGFAHSVEASVGDQGIAISVINTGEVRTNLGSAEGTPWKERYDEDEAPAPSEIADTVVFAVEQDLAVSEINIHPRDKLGRSL